MGTGYAAAPWPLGFGRLPEISRQDVLDAPDMAFGRMDAFCRLGLAACSQALRHAGVYPKGNGRSLDIGTGIVVATVTGCLRTDQDYQITAPPLAEAPSPHLFAYTLPNVLLGEMALRFDLRGPALALQVESASSSRNGVFPPLQSAVAMAMDMLETGEADSMLAGYCELGKNALASDIPRGALFLLLEKTGSGAYPWYGSCGRSDTEEIRITPQQKGALPPLLVTEGG